MPIPMNNQASIRYSYPGATAPETALSNVTNTTKLEEYGVTASKTTLTRTFRPGENITFVTRVENIGQGPLYNLTITESLGTDAATGDLVYLADSAVVYVGGIPAAVTPVVDGNKLTFHIPGAVPSRQTILIAYCARVNPALNVTVGVLTGTSAVTANCVSDSGPLVQPADAAEASVALDQYADLAVAKAVDKRSVASGDMLTYTFTLINTGSQPSVDTVLTDTLPAGFTPNLVTSVVGGVTTVYTDDQYELDDKTNTLTLPVGGATLSVPAATISGPGTAEIIVSGVVE